MPKSAVNSHPSLCVCVFLNNITYIHNFMKVHVCYIELQRVTTEVAYFMSDRFLLKTLLRIPFHNSSFCKSP